MRPSQASSSLSARRGEIRSRHWSLSSHHPPGYSSSPTSWDMLSYMALVMVISLSAPTNITRNITRSIISLMSPLTLTLQIQLLSVQRTDAVYLNIFQAVPQLLPAGRPLPHPGRERGPPEASLCPGLQPLHQDRGGRHLGGAWPASIP